MWTTIVQIVLKLLFGAGKDAVDKQRQRADTIELGQRRQQTADQQIAIDAQRRMDAAGAKPHDDQTTGDDLRGGRF